MSDTVDASEHPSTSAALRELMVLERTTLNDGETSALFDGDDEYARLLVVNETDDDTATVRTEGGADNAVVDHGASFGNASGAASNNVFHDGSDYVVENSTGNDGRDYTIVGERVV
jgi:hypothetical protein